MDELEKMMAELKQLRDELRLKLHLGTKDAMDEWDDLTKQWDQFVSNAQLDQSADEVGEAAKKLGLKIKEAYERARKAM